MDGEIETRHSIMQERLERMMPAEASAVNDEESSLPNSLGCSELIRHFRYIFII